MVRGFPIVLATGYARSAAMSTQALRDVSDPDQPAIAKVTWMLLETESCPGTI